MRKTGPAETEDVKVAKIKLMRYIHYNNNNIDDNGNL